MGDSQTADQCREGAKKKLTGDPVKRREAYVPISFLQLMDPLSTLSTFWDAGVPCTPSEPVHR